LELCALATSRLCVEIHGINQLSTVKVADRAAKFAGLRYEQSWQYVTPVGELGDNIWQGVPHIVSYCQIKSAIFTFGHISSRNFFRNARLQPGNRAISFRSLQKTAVNRNQPGYSGLQQEKICDRAGKTLAGSDKASQASAGLICYCA